MASGSDDETGLCTSKRPKTKLQTKKDVSNSDKEHSENEENEFISVKDRTKDVTPIKENKKAAKRGRESDEESSITSDEETMSKKRVRKDSDEDIGPKKRFSVEVRKRREAARSVIEKKKAILDSDSDCESETQLEAYEPDIVSNKSDSNNTPVVAASKERISHSENKQNIQQNCEVSIKEGKVFSKKNEDSSSAYNSDSEGNKVRKVSKKKVTNYKKSNDELSGDTEDENISIKAPERKSASSKNCSEDEAGESSSDLGDKKHNNTAKVKSKEKQNSPYESDCNVSVGEVRTLSIADKKTVSKYAETESNEFKSNKVKEKKLDSESIKNARKLLKNSDSESKLISSPKQIRGKADDRKHDKLSKYKSSDSDSDDVPLAKTKTNNTLKEAKEESSDSDRPLGGKKSMQTKKVQHGSKIEHSSDEQSSEASVKHNSNKEVSFQQNCSSPCDDSSDEDSLEKNSDSSEKHLKISPTKARKGKKSIPSSIYDDDSPLKRSKADKGKQKSKETNRKLASSSDSEKDDGNLQKEDKVSSQGRKNDVKSDMKSKLSPQGICDELNKSSDDSDVPLKVVSADKSGKKLPVIIKNESESDSEEESRDDKSHKHQGRKERVKEEVSSSSDKDSDSDSKDKSVRKDSSSVSQCKNEEKSKIKSKQKLSVSEISDSDSDGDEPLQSKSKPSNKKGEKKSKSVAESSSGHASDSNSDSRKKVKKEKKAIGKWEVRINSYKKYINAAGIRIKSYALLWEGCKNDKQRADKLQKLLEDNGVKGRPSLQKCKKVREKLERKREIEELDLNNIIEDDGEHKGRYRCRSSRREETKSRNVSEVIRSKEASEKAAEIKERFSRIKDLIDSDSSSD